MPAARRYYDCADVMEILKVSRAQAWRYLHMFERWGLAFKQGRVLRVRADRFDSYLDDPTGYAARAESQMRMNAKQTGRRMEVLT